MFSRIFNAIDEWLEIDRWFETRLLGIVIITGFLTFCRILVSLLGMV